MIKTTQGNLNPNLKLQGACRILEKYRVFLTVNRDDGDPDNYTVQMAHGAIGHFLREHSDVAEKKGPERPQYVSIDFLRQCCLGYLMQPTYSVLLEKIDPRTFVTKSLRENVHSHRFLSYAAKYWHYYFDTKGDSGQDSDQSGKSSSDGLYARVINFMGSSNFVTCIQVQSLFIVGHFLHRFDPITDEIDTTKRVLPNWLHKEHAMFQQYMEFASEWADLLQNNLSAESSGDLKQCFWKTLGNDNFLSSNESRYKCFVLGRNEKDSKVCRIQHISPTGTEVTSCWLSPG